MKCIALAMLMLAVCATAQTGEPNRQGGERRMMMGAGTAGSITAISGDTVQLKTMNGGTATVKVSDKTQFRKDRQPAKLSDFKVGDTIVVRGEQDAGGAYQAQMISKGGVGGNANMMMTGPGGQLPGTAGTITAINGDVITLRSLMGGEAKVKVSDKTQYRRDQNAAKLADFKPGEMVAVRGKQAADGAWEADLVASANQQMRTMTEGLGTQFIAGRVKAIEGTRLVIERIDQQEQTIEVDEDTSFKKNNESITLPDIKVGDMVFGRGAMKNGIFVPTTLNVGLGQMRMQVGSGPM